jgi:D-3-phosphoglycerate dehydrogenase
LNSSKRPVIWIGEPDGFSTRAKSILEAYATVIYKEVNSSQLKEVFQNCDAFIFRLGLKIEEQHLLDNQRCKLIATPVTGIDHIDLEACGNKNILILSLKNETEFLNQVRATAEHTFALILSLIRKLVPATKSIEAGSFDRQSFKGSELYQKTLGIIGYGRLGKIVAKYAGAFDMKIIFHDIKLINPERIDHIAVSLNDLLSKADIVSLHVDANPSNANMVNEIFLNKMKVSAILINTSRGSVVDEAALVTALENKKIAGAALDVVSGEPEVNFDSSLFEYLKLHDNLLITPHIGGNTTESFEKTECFIAEKIIQQLMHA